jgi:hypothetical protein
MDLGRTIANSTLKKRNKAIVPEYPTKALKKPKASGEYNLVSIGVNNNANIWAAAADPNNVRILQK